jgi:PAS domain-containing protein
LHVEDEAEGRRIPYAELPMVKAIVDRRPQRGVVVRARRHDGQHVWLRLNVEPMFGDGDQPPAEVVSFADITDQKLIELTLRDREAVMSAIVAGAGDAVELTDLETLRFVEFNDTACRLLGYTREEYAKLSVTDIEGQPRCRPVAKHGGDTAWPTSPSASKPAISARTAA